MTQQIMVEAMINHGYDSTRCRVDIRQGIPKVVTFPNDRTVNPRVFVLESVETATLSNQVQRLYYREYKTKDVVL